MAQIKQVQIAFVPIEDRLLMRMNTSDGDEFRFWLTRRYVRLLLPQLHNLLARDPAVSVQANPQARDAMLTFRQEQALSGADFSRNFEAGAARLPLGPQPVLLARLQIKPGPGGAPVLCMHPEQGAGIEVALNIELIHSITKLLADTVAKAQWELLAAPAATTGPAQAAAPTIN